VVLELDWNNDNQKEIGRDSISDQEPYKGTTKVRRRKGLRRVKRPHFSNPASIDRGKTGPGKREESGAKVNLIETKKGEKNNRIDRIAKEGT